MAHSRGSLSAIGVLAAASLGWLAFGPAAVPDAHAQLLRARQPCCLPAQAPCQRCPPPYTPGVTPIEGFEPRPIDPDAVPDLADIDVDPIFPPTGMELAGGPVTAAPNMIGDGFGASSGQLFITPTIREIDWLRASDGRKALFSLGTFSSLRLFNLDDIEINREELAIIQEGSQWESLEPISFPPPEHIRLDENPEETSAWQAAYPSAEDVTWNSGDAYRFEDEDEEWYLYNVRTDYTILFPEITVDLPSPAAAALVGRMKLVENSSPLPRNRVFFNYSYFHNTRLQPEGVDVNRFVPGFERTFLNDQASLEMRIPFATTLDSDIIADGPTEHGSLQFGNLTMYFKGLLYSTDTFALSSGLGVSLPTADDLRVRFADGTDLLQIENRAVYLQPFVGALYAPDQRCFAQGILQFDLDVRGNPVRLSSFEQGQATGLMHRVGRIDDVDFMYASISTGYWLHRGYSRGALGVTGFAPVLELHYNRAISNPQLIAGEQNATTFQIGNTSRNIEFMNLTVGAITELGGNRSMQAAYVVPVMGGSDRQFDGELRLSLNWFFGGRGTGRF